MQPLGKFTSWFQLHHLTFSKTNSNSMCNGCQHTVTSDGLTSWLLLYSWSVYSRHSKFTPEAGSRTQCVDRPVSLHTDSRNTITWVLGVPSTQYSRCSENGFVLVQYLWSSCSTVFYIKQWNKANSKTKVMVVGQGRGGGRGTGNFVQHKRGRSLPFS